VSRGYFMVGIEKPKRDTNIGSLCRSAFSFGAKGMFLIKRNNGNGILNQVSDTVKSWRHIPLLKYDSTEDFLSCGIPHSCELIGVELHEQARGLKGFVHPERAIYILGSEDNGLSQEVIDRCVHLIQLPGKCCLNVAVAGSIVLCDRVLKEEP